MIRDRSCRSAVAALIGHAGLTCRAAADQLGYANTSMTSDVYFGRKVAAIGAAAVMHAIDVSAGDVGPVA